MLRRITYHVKLASMVHYVIERAAYDGAGNVRSVSVVKTSASPRAEDMKFDRGSEAKDYALTMARRDHAAATRLDMKAEVDSTRENVVTVEIGATSG